MSSAVLQFQSTLPRGERPFRATRSAQMRDFNPRSREGSDEWGQELTTIGTEFQSTLPRGERRQSWRGWQRKGGFQSTLPRGERQDSGVDTVEGLVISIHAPARGATVKVHGVYDPLDISIHAPARGATQTRRMKLWDYGFQSTLPRGERRCFKKSYPLRPGFQSTLPRGERPRSALPAARSLYFNPRSREGSDGRR